MMLKYKEKSSFEKSYGPDPRIYTDESPNYKKETDVPAHAKAVVQNFFKRTPPYAKTVNKMPEKFFAVRHSSLSDEDYLKKIRKYIPKRTGQVKTIGNGWTWSDTPTSNKVEEDNPLVPYTYDDIVFCPECGWEIVENVVICEQCGVDLK